MERRLVGSDGVLASNFIREAGSNNFLREKICVLNSRELCPNRKVVVFAVIAIVREANSVFAFKDVHAKIFFSIDFF